MRREEKETGGSAGGEEGGPAAAAATMLPALADRKRRRWQSLRDALRFCTIPTTPLIILRATGLRLCPLISSFPSLYAPTIGRDDWLCPLITYRSFQ